MLFRLLDRPDLLVLLTFCLIFALSFHEFAHAWVANRFGDPTAKLAGRLTTNPLVHLDLMGGLMLNQCPSTPETSGIPTQSFLSLLPGL
jgi:Zn-dependent protease